MDIVNKNTYLKLKPRFKKLNTMNLWKKILQHLEYLFV